MKWLKDNKGFTLIEMLIVIGIMTSCFGVIALMINSVFTTYKIGYDKSIVLKQIDLVSFAISNDINRAQSIQVPDANYGFPLKLTCYKWNGSTMSNVAVTYDYDSTENTIIRTETSSTTVSTTIIARYIVSPGPTSTRITGGAQSDNYTCTITFNALYNNVPAIGTYKAKQRVIP